MEKFSENHVNILASWIQKKLIDCGLRFAVSYLQGL